MNSFIIAFFSIYFSFSSIDKGQKVEDIKLNNQKGKEISLYDLKGKLVLIDFWASWCGPCRNENPNVIEAYNKYHKKKFKNAKGFEVFSVSLDRDMNQWKNAILKDGLIWKNHVIDEKGIAQKFGVISIPFAILIDGDGIILAKGKDLRGLGLHIEIEKYLK